MVILNFGDVLTKSPFTFCYFFSRRMIMFSSFKRNAKLYGIQMTDEFMKAYHQTTRLLNDISARVAQDLSGGFIVSINAPAGANESYVQLSDGQELTRARYRDHIQDVLDKHPIVTKKKGLERDLVGYILERYNGYSKRNNKNTNRITIKGKSLYYKNRCIKVDIDNKQLTFETVFGDFALDYKHGLKEDMVVTDKFGKVGGNFILKQRALVVVVNVPFVSAYSPECELGFDMNKTGKDWVVFNDGETISLPADIEKTMEEIKTINKDLDRDKKKPVPERQWRSPERRKIRLKLQTVHKKLKAKIDNVAESIVAKAIQQKALLCIDSVKGGQSMGTFGQDHLIPEVMKLCENQGVPFYVVPCKNTSRRCSECGHIAKGNRTTTEGFCCVSCGFTEVSHKNAAINIVYQGKRLYDAQIPYGNYHRRNVDNLIEKHLAAAESKLVPLG